MTACVAKRLWEVDDGNYREHPDGVALNLGAAIARLLGRALQSKPESNHPRLPTVRASNSLFVAYAEVFQKEMATITAFSEAEVKAMHRQIADGKGGPLNQGRFHKAIFKKYFEPREWIWPEYEEWSTLFRERNEWPVRWRAGQHVDYAKYSGVYPILMRTILFRARGLLDQRRQIQMGRAESKLILLFETDRKFVDIALAKDPNAIPPFFPDDLSRRQAMIPGLD